MINTEIPPHPPSIARLLAKRGLADAGEASAYLNPSLDQLKSPYAFADMKKAVDRLLQAVKAEQPVAIYADRDVDGLSGLAVLVRTLRTIGGQVVWGSPVKGRGVERAVLERLTGSGARVMVLVDCGTGEHAELEWLASQGVDVIVADHHRFTESRPPALAWIHPEAAEKTSDPAPAGCVMAFKLAQAIWLSYLGNDDPERMDYFLFSHLDLVCLGILADRMPLQGENRILVWHGLRRLAHTRKAGLAMLTRFFRLTPRSGPLTVREVTWQVIPILNAGGRLGRPELTADLLVTEDPDTVHACIDQLLELNTRRRAAQDQSLAFFEKAVLEQCSVETDPVLVALAEGLEPSVTGLAAQSLARKYGRPAFLFVSQGAESVGSGRGLPGVDLFAWVEAHQDAVIKYGGHQGAVGLTIRTVDFKAFRGRLLAAARDAKPLDGAPVPDGEVGQEIEADVDLTELDGAWWMSLERLGPFGTGNPMPLFQVTGIEAITPAKKTRSKQPCKNLVLKSGPCELRAENLSPAVVEGAGPWTVVGYPAAVKKNAGQFSWIIQDIRRSSHG